MASMKIICLFLVFAVVAAQLGGHQPADLNDAGTRAAEALAKEEAVKVSEVCQQGVQLKDAKRQTVNGVNYTFTYEADPTQCGQTGAKKTCTVKVHSTPSQETNIQSATCA